MSGTTTPRLSLYKPAAVDNVNVTTDVNNNMDTLDLAPGFQVVTSTTRPSTPYSGKAIAESDTSYRSYFSNGTGPASGSWVELVNSSGTFGSDIKIASTAKLVIGVDSNLYRSAANTLKTDDNLIVGIDLSSIGNTTVGGDLKLVNGTTIYRNKLNSPVTLANTVTETVIATMTIPANDAVVGAIYRLRVMGRISAAAATTPTISFISRLGGVAGTALDTNGAHTLSSGISTKPFLLDLYVTCLTTGVSGTWESASILSENFTVATATGTVKLPSTDAVATRDTTISNTFVLTGTWGTAAAGNTLTTTIVAAERVA